MSTLAGQLVLRGTGMVTVVFATICMILHFQYINATMKVSTVSLTLTKGGYLSAKYIQTIRIAGLKMCTTMCYRSTSCSSLNYNRKQFECQLIFSNESNPTVVSDPDYSYSTKDSWFGFGGPCEQNPCSDPNQICVDRNDKRFCVYSECMNFPESVRHASIRNATSLTKRTVWNEFLYVCNEGFRRFGPAITTCQPDLTFTDPDPDLICYRVYGDWILAARFTEGIGGSPRSLWATSGEDSDKDDDVEDECFSIEASNACTHHYRSGLVDQWASIGVQEVKIAFYNNGVEEAYITFNGVGTTAMTWFDVNKITGSSWTDVDTTMSYIFFSMAGFSNDQLDRSFVISKVLNVCYDDFGWMHILEGTGFCGYDNFRKYPFFMFSKSSGAGNQDTGFDFADVFAILLKVNNLP